MTSVPQSEPFKAKLRRWSKPPRELALTRTGKFMCLMTLSVGFGAINTGNNLLFLLFGMMMALILASGVLSEAVIRNLRAERILPQRATAGLPARGAYILHNDKNHACLSIEVTDRMAKATGGPLNGQTIGKRTARWWQFWKPTHTGIEIASVYSARLERNAFERFSANFFFETRGRYSLTRLIADTRFPFSMFEKSRRFDTDSEIIVHPAATEVPDWVRQVSRTVGEESSNDVGLGFEFYGLRDYREGEDVRSIHWKTSARRGTFVVRDSEKEVDTAVHVVLVNSAPAGLSNVQFETLVSKTAGLLDVLSNSGVPVGLSISGHTIDPEIGRAHLDQLLDLLAVVERTPTFEPRDLPEIGTCVAIGTANGVANASFDYDISFSDGA